MLVYQRVTQEKQVIGSFFWLIREEKIWSTEFKKNWMSDIINHPRIIPEYHRGFTSNPIIPWSKPSRSVMLVLSPLSRSQASGGSCRARMTSALRQWEHRWKVEGSTWCVEMSYRKVVLIRIHVNAVLMWCEMMWNENWGPCIFTLTVNQDIFANMFKHWKVSLADQNAWWNLHM
jgi:hypothetical protein